MGSLLLVFVVSTIELKCVFHCTMKLLQYLDRVTAFVAIFLLLFFIMGCIFCSICLAENRRMFS